MRTTRMQHRYDSTPASHSNRASRGSCTHFVHFITVMLACALLLAGCGRTAHSLSSDDSSDSNAAASGVTAAGKTAGTADKSSTPDAKTTTDKGKKSAGKDDTLSHLEKEDVVALFSTLPETVTSQFMFQDILPVNPEASSWHYMNGGGQYWKGTNEADYRIEKEKLQAFYATLLNVNPNEPPLDSLSGYYKDSGLSYDLKEMTDAAGKPFVRVTLERSAVNFDANIATSGIMQTMPFPVPDLTDTKLTRFVYDDPAHEKNGGYFWLVVYECEDAMEDVFASYEAMQGYQSIENYRTWKSDEGTACEIVGTIADSKFTLRTEKLDTPEADPLDGRTYRTRVEIRLTDDTGRMY